MALSPDRRVAVLLAEITAVQMLGAMAVLTIPAIAPKVADALSAPASFMGGQISLVYLAAMGASLAAGKAIAALGAWRTSQAAMLLTAAGSALASLGDPAALVAGRW